MGQKIARNLYIQIQVLPGIKSRLFYRPTGGIQLRTQLTLKGGPSKSRVVLTRPHVPFAYSLPSENNLRYIFDL